MAYLNFRSSFMKKFLVGVLSLAVFGAVSYADFFDDGVNAYNNGNKQKAVKLWEKACEGGHMEGCFNSGILYSTGDGVKQNKQKAVEFYEKACDAGKIDGCYNVGNIYFKGDGVKRNLQKAKKFYKKACDAGDTEGCAENSILEMSGIVEQSALK